MVDVTWAESHVLDFEDGLLLLEVHGDTEEPDVALVGELLAPTPRGLFIRSRPGQAVVDLQVFATAASPASPHSERQVVEVRSDGMTVRSLYGLPYTKIPLASGAWVVQANRGAARAVPGAPWVVQFWPSGEE